jgi:signal transduction histidine kinase
MRGSGRTGFVGILLLIVGTLNIIYGIGSLNDAKVLVGDQRLIFTSLHGYGWSLIILGVIQLTGGISLLGGNTYGRVVGIIGATLGALDALVAIGGRDPWWSLGAFALCVYILHGLLVFDTDVRASESSGRY